MKIEVDLHTHSNYSAHSYSTIYENVMYAVKRGLKGIGITDHGPVIEDGGHVWHFHALKDLPEFAEGVRLFKGIEASLLNADGKMDIDKVNAHNMDYIIASYHGSFEGIFTKEDLERAYLNAMENPQVKILGHIDRGPFEIDYQTIITKAKEKNIAVELNKHSLELDDVYRGRVIKIAEICNDLKVPVVVNSDAHFCTEIGNVGIITDLLTELDFDEGLIINANYENTVKFIGGKQ
ncbi:MAG: PHP domain-containing protein [Clostridia bacterium]|nr:PHP domain-containing protein [Clostridia bacterium]